MKSDTSASDLVISTKNIKSLSKTQLEFNKVSAKIQKLEIDIVKNQEKLDRVLQFYSSNLSKKLSKTTELKKDFCFALDAVSKKQKLSKKTTEQIGDLILNFLDDIFHDEFASEDLQTLYNTWSEISFQEKNEQDEEFAKMMMATMMKNQFNVDLDLDDIDLNSQESYEKIKKQILESSQQNEREEAAPKKKTKKQLEKENLQKAEEELKSKNLRSIYITLTKLLHPDAESDEKTKLEKEEIMKQVTIAYEEKDLSTLLKLEIEWIHKNSDFLSELSEQKLKSYVSVIKERMKELKDELDFMDEHPKYSPIRGISRMTEKSAIKEIEKTTKERATFNANLITNQKTVSKLTSKKDLNEFINAMHSNFIHFDMDDFFDFF